MSASSSSQKFIARNRAPRVQIEYDVEIYGSEKKIELPFVMGVLADLSGKPAEPLPGVDERKFLEIDIDNFDERMKAIAPRVAFMGLNSVSDYWDSARHDFEEPLRERDWVGKTDEVAQRALQQRPQAPFSRKPLRDHALRIEGNALIDVHQNFARAWNRAALLPRLAAASNADARPVRGTDLDPATSRCSLTSRATSRWRLTCSSCCTRERWRR